MRQAIWSRLSVMGDQCRCLRGMKPTFRKTKETQATHGRCLGCVGLLGNAERGDWPRRMATRSQVVNLISSG